MLWRLLIVGLRSFLNFHDIQFLTKIFFIESLFLIVCSLRYHDIIDFLFDTFLVFGNYLFYLLIYLTLLDLYFVFLTHHWSSLRKSTIKLYIQKCNIFTMFKWNKNCTVNNNSLSKRFLKIPTPNAL